MLASYSATCRAVGRIVVTPEHSKIGESKMGEDLFFFYVQHTLKHIVVTCDSAYNTLVSK